MFKRNRTDPRAEPDGLVGGIARVDKSTKALIGRLQPGEIAVIDHDDLDRVAAEGLVERQVKVVLNAAPSASGRYPNLGPLVLAGAEIPLIDNIGADLFAVVKDGDYISVDDRNIFSNGEIIAKGQVVTLEVAQANLDSSKEQISNALEVFAENTLSYMLAERDFLLEAVRLPEVDTDFAGRHVLVVVRGYGYKEDLGLLRHSYIPDFKPVLVGVDGGADALLEIGFTPDLIIGDMDSVSTHALVCGAELVVHAFADGRAPGRERLDALGLPYSTFESPGTSEDVAFLLAHEKGAELMVAVGARASMIEFMDKGRKGMASTFLVRLRVGPKLVDAKGVSELHRAGPTGIEILALVIAAFVTMLIIIRISPPMHLVGAALSSWLKNLVFTLQRAVS